MDRIIEQQFVKKVLRHQGDRLLRNQGRSLYVKARFKTGRMEKDRDISVSGGDDLDGVLRFRHVDYERFLDMKRDVKIKNGKSRRKSGFRIHNRFVYGHYFAIAKQLSVGLTEGIKQQIRDELNTNING